MNEQVSSSSDFELCTLCTMHAAYDDDPIKHHYITNYLLVYYFVSSMLFFVSLKKKMLFHASKNDADLIDSIGKSGIQEKKNIFINHK